MSSPLRFSRDFCRLAAEKAEGASRRIKYAQTRQGLDLLARSGKDKLFCQRAERVFGNGEILAAPTASRPREVTLRTQAEPVDEPVTIRFVEINVALE